MAHIAIVTSLLTGRINASFEMASRLQKEGHSISYLCQPKSQKRIEENGFSCVPVTEITFDYVDPRLLKTASWFQKFKFHYKHLNSHFSEGEKILKLAAHKETLQQVKPDLVLVDTEMHDFIFTAFELKIPVKLFTTWFSDTISSKSPSIRTKVIPGQGFGGTTVGVMYSWLLMRLKINARVFVDKLTFNNYRRWMFKKYAQNIGFNTRGLLVNTLPPLYSFTKLPVVTMTMSELEFPHQLSDNMIYVGAMVHQKRYNDTSLLPVLERLEAIYKVKRNGNKKLIYCSVGSLAVGYLPFLKKVIEAVADVEDWILILSIGPKMELNTFTEVPQNVYLFNWVPQLNVIEQSDCAIVSCGKNTINECIHFKVPMLFYSGGYTDQHGNAAKMSYHGLGIRGDIFEDSSITIRKNIESIFADTSYKNKVDHYNAIYQTYCERKLSPLLFD